MISYTELDEEWGQVKTNVGCTFHSQVDDSSYPVLHTITLPNDQTYTFDYDATYGVVSKIVYPDGGWVSYTWGLPTNSSGGPVYTDLATFTGLGNTTNLPAGPCYYQFQMPVILERQVGYSAGSSAAETQTFSYNTTWQSGTSSVYWGTKTTTVKTTDNARKLTSQTIYSYTPVYLSTQPDAYSLPSPEIAVENTVTTYDWGNTSTPLEQVTETWVDPYAMTSQTVELNNNPNLVSKTVYCYSNPCPTTSTSGSDILVQKQEYDFGQTSPTRTTNYSYYGFSQPSKIVVTNSSSTRLAETDAYYDGMTASSSTIVPVAGPSVTVVTGTHDETNKGPSSTQPRGNLTTLVRWASTGTSPTTTYTYDETGQLRSKTDACGNTTCSDMSGSLHTTTYSYADSPEGGNSPGNSNAYLTEIVHPVVNGIGMQERFAYDYATGNLTSSEDPNSNTTGYQYEDSLNRLTEITYPDGGTTKYTYNDSVPSVETSTLLTGSTWKTSLSTMDGLGHVISASLTSDPEGADTIATTYDGEGRVYTQTNPERSGSSATDGTTTFTYDALGRKTAQLQQDNTSYLYWCYNGVQSQGNLNCSSKAGSVSTGTWVDSTDENGNHWQRASDALGRLTSVMEPNPTSNALALETDYTYDALDNLLTVNQRGGSGDTARPARTFSYDGLSRLVTSYNPETGTICYGTYSGSTCNEGYDANGNLIAKTDARGAVTNYSYDALNRILHKTYTIPASANPPISPTSGVAYTYDVAVGGWGWPTQTSPPTGVNVSQTNLIGRLSYATVGLSVPIPNEPNVNYPAWTLYGYDTMGRTLLKSECLPQTCGNDHYDLHYRYDLAGNMTLYDRGMDSGRNSSFPGEGFYYGGFNQSYDAAGRLISVVGDGYDDLGANTTQSILESATYYPTGQMYQSTRLGFYPSTLSYNSRGWYTGQTVNDGFSGDQIWYNTAGHDIAGNVNSTTDRQAGSWTHKYDHLNRLISSSGTPTGGSPESLSFTYDSFGNRLSENASSATYTAGNQFSAATGNTYDASGNVIYDGFHHYAYDAEGRLYSVDGTTCYLYDADDDRVGAFDCKGVSSADYLFDIDHRMVTQLNLSSWTVQRANIYAGGEFIGEDSPDPFLTNTATATQLRITDQVGSLRSLWDTGQNWVGAWGSFPFGDGAVAGDGGDSDDNPGGFLYTGKERDTESGLDYFGARYYSSNMGRMMSPDWSAKVMPVPYAKLGDPQTLNLYSYVGNNPLSRTDPTGHYVINCGGDVKNCSQQQKNFNDAVAAGLKSKDQSVVQAAKAYGALGEKNGVSVSIVNVVDPKNSNVTGNTGAAAGTGGIQFSADGKTFMQATQVNIQAGLSATQLSDTTVHEGQHVGDRENFVNGLQVDRSGQLVQGLNITHRQSEINAYGVENDNRGQRGESPRDINDVLAHPPYSTNPDINKPLFPEFPSPY